MLELINTVGWALLTMLPLIAVVFWTSPAFSLNRSVAAHRAAMEEDDEWDLAQWRVSGAVNPRPFSKVSVRRARPSFYGVSL